MSDEPSLPPAPEPLDRAIGAHERRKLRARRTGAAHPWIGLASFGLIGWSVAVPILAGVALGVWLDHHYPGKLSWTLTLLGVGVVAGCLTAWHWVAQEHRQLREEDRDG